MVYADMLSERGDPRGEFIQLQCRAEAGPYTAEDAQREGELLRAHAREWLDAIWENIDPGSVHFRRGFLSRCLVKDRHPLDAALPAWKTVEHLDLEIDGPTEERWQRLEALAGMPRLRSLSGVLPRTLARSSLANKVRQLELNVYRPPEEVDFQEPLEGVHDLPPTCGLSFELRHDKGRPEVAWAQWQALCAAGLGERCVRVQIRSLQDLARWLDWMNNQKSRPPALALLKRSWHWGREGAISLTLERSSGRVGRARADAGGTDPLSMQAAVREGLPALLGALAGLEPHALDELTLFPRLPCLLLRESEASALLERLACLRARVTHPEIRRLERAL